MVRRGGSSIAGVATLLALGAASGDARLDQPGRTRRDVCVRAARRRPASSRARCTATSRQAGSCSSPKTLTDPTSTTCACSRRTTSRRWRLPTARSRHAVWAGGDAIVFDSAARSAARLPSSGLSRRRPDPAHRGHPTPATSALASPRTGRRSSSTGTTTRRTAISASGSCPAPAAPARRSRRPVKTAPRPAPRTPRSPRTIPRSCTRTSSTGKRCRAACSWSTRAGARRGGSRPTSSDWARRASRPTGRRSCSASTWPTT